MSAPGTVTPEGVGGVIEPGQLMSRSQIAKALGREKTTWVISRIEMAVELGIISKAPGYIHGQGAWVYARPETMEALVS